MNFVRLSFFIQMIFFRIKEEYPEFMEVMKKISSEKTEKTIQLMLEGVIL